MIDEKKLIEDIHNLPIQVEVSKAVGHSRPFVDTADILECVENQPKVGEWIPCSERLPQPNVNVLICFYDGRRKKISDYSDGRKKSIRIDKIINKYGEPAFWSKGNTPSVIAWMPLPQPY